MIFRKDKLRPLIKWPGGKDSELNYLRRNHLDRFPKTIKNFYEPFVGGGACFFSIKAEKSFINDKCQELISLYRFVKEQNQELFKVLNGLAERWIAVDEVIAKNEKQITEWYYEGKDQELGELGNVKRKLKAMRKRKADKDIAENIRGVLKADIYKQVRSLYNHKELPEPERIAYYSFLRDYCYSCMFRYNSKGHFNVPYGGITYNDIMPNGRLGYWQSEKMVEHLSKAVICCQDFEEFLREQQPQEGDFVFLDPPYDTVFSTYNNNAFGAEDQKRLANYLKTCKANWMLLIKETDLILDLYKDQNILQFNKQYIANFRNRNEREVKHLVITSVFQ